MTDRIARRPLATAIGALVLSLSVALLLRPVAAVDPQPTGAQAAANAAAPSAEPTKESTSLADDGRIGTASDLQGIVLLKPPLGERWSPLRNEAPLGDRDRIRTDVLGANAVKLRLARGFELTLGPGTEIEFQGTAELRLITGELQVATDPRWKPTPESRLELLAIFGPTKDEKPQWTATDGKKTFLRIDRDGKLATIDDPKALPKWLASFEATATQEPLGSLVVSLPDGRNEPLSIGYHKVDVEIRDQIARTTIEESFVNHTASRLEGVFHFPLPADASTSGFGMWIGDELVEADVVEKQRAREIFDTILREKRDPGLLEWTSGNLFKARVFPIEPRSEKRVKITYTQVLPLADGKFRYHYALRSDLLRTKPVRELSVNVTIASARPIADVACGTHPARITRTPDSARIDYSAQAVSPKRDFELVCSVDTPERVTVIPHRRGDDGYLLVQLALPKRGDSFHESAAGESEPLSLILLCDTSGSTDRRQRVQQAEFVSTLLASLGPRDRFQLGCVDVGIAWATPQAVPASAATTAHAREFLLQRRSLGWTNLDAAFVEVLRDAPFGSQVVYIGDGIPTTGDRDPAAFVRRLRERFEKRRGAETSSSAKNPPQTTLHAVTIGNVHEAIVMQGIASVGGGSTRAILGERTPQLVAAELLEELTSPGLRDVTIEFRGARVAAQYPERVTNVVDGVQQTIVARYLPEGKDQSGRVIVRGKRGSRNNATHVEYTANFKFADAEHGNSFLPRLWARAHLDHLLAQGSTAEIRRQVIELSEEFHIITPYTSLLVLESDEDRRRFGVVRRFEMRDGEDFFREGKAKADFELAAAESRKAREWRVGLRGSVLQQLGKLGRNPDAFSHLLPMDSIWNDLGEPVLAVMGSYVRPLFGIMPMDFDARISGFEPGYRRPFVVSVIPVAVGYDAPDGQSMPLSFTTASFDGVDGPWDSDGDGDGATTTEPDAGGAIDDLESARFYDADVQLLQTMERSPALTAGDADFKSILAGARRPGRYGEASYASLGMSGYAEPSCGYSPRPEELLLQAFPYLAPKPGAAPSEEQRKALLAKQPDKFSGWSPEATTLVEGLLRVESLKKLAGGLVVEARGEHFRLNWNAERGHDRAESRILYAPKSWLTRVGRAGGDVAVEACDERERLKIDVGSLLGRRRPSTPSELTPDVLVDFAPGATMSLREAYAFHTAKVERREGKIAVVRIASHDGSQLTTYTLDTEKNVITHSTFTQSGTVQNDVEYADFVEVAGGWWPGTIRSHNGDARLVHVTKVAYRRLNDADFAARRQAELALAAETLFLPVAMPSLDTARRRLTDGSATFADRLAVLQEYCARQLADEAWSLFERMEKLDGGTRRGFATLRLKLLEQLRRRDEAWRLLKAEAEQLAAAPQPDDLARAVHRLAYEVNLVPDSERPAYAESLQPVFERSADREQALAAWRMEYAKSLGAAERTAEEFALEKELVEVEPWDEGRRNTYARNVAARGDVAGALAYLEASMQEFTNRNEQGWMWLGDAYIRIAREASRAKQLLAFTERWSGLHPDEPRLRTAYLEALDFNDRTADADATGLRWLAEARDGELTPERRAKLEGALRFARNNFSGRNGPAPPPWSNDGRATPDDRWSAALADTARYFFRRPGELGIAAEALSGDDRSEARLRGELFLIFRNEVATLSLEQIEFLYNHTINGLMTFSEPLAGRKETIAADLPAQVWQPILDALVARWEKAPGRDEEFTGVATERHRLASVLEQLYEYRGSEAGSLSFRRLRVERAAPSAAWAARYELFDALLRTPWTQATEDEALGLLETLGDPALPETVATSRIHALHEFVDKMIEARQAAAETKLKDQGNTDKLTRTEFATKRKQFRVDAVTAVADRLEQLERRAPAMKLPLEWVRMERMTLDVRLNRRSEQIAKECSAILGNAPPMPTPPADEAYVEPAARIESELKSLLSERALALLEYLSLRRGAKPEWKAEVVRYLDAALEQAARPELLKWSDGDAVLEARRLEKYRYLIALDRADDLERDLRTWIREAQVPAPWRRRLALVRAERGDLKEAIGLMEAAERESFSTASDYRRLAAWYLATDARAQYEQASLEELAASPPQQLQRFLGIPFDGFGRDGEPISAVPKDTALRVIRTLLTRTSAPEQYFTLIRRYYEATQEPQALRWLPDTALGRTTAEINSYLSNVWEVLGAVRNEAPLDEMTARLKELRAGKLTPADRRALDWFEAIAEWKCAATLNQPGPHVAAASAALARAFDGGPATYDDVAEAALLRNLGRTIHPELRDLQLKRLTELGRRAKPGSIEQLRIAEHHAQTLFHFYDRRNEALLRLEAEWKTYLAANGRKLTNADAPRFADYIDLLVRAERHTAAEALIDDLTAQARTREERSRVNTQAWEVYSSALLLGKETKLGGGETLLNNLIARGLREVDDAQTDKKRIDAVDRLLRAFRAGRQGRVSGAAAALATFVRERMPEILKRQVEDYGDLAERPIDYLKADHGHEAWRYAIARIEQWPDRRPVRNERWRLFRHVPDGPLVGTKHAPADAADLEARALKLAQRRFREYCLLGDDPQQGRYFTRNSFDPNRKIHAEDIAAYLEVAEQVYRERSGSGETVARIASFLWNRLDRRNRAVEMLMAAKQADLLDDGARRRLAGYLRERRRFPEEVALLEELVGRLPDDVGLRCDMLKAYHATKQPIKVSTEFAAIDAHFHQRGLWDESKAATLAEACAAVGRHDDALRFFTEAIALRRRAIGSAKDAGIAAWYEQIAKLRAGRGDTAAAVEAALGAIVVRGDTQELRAQSLAVLDEILSQAKDLDRFVKSKDDEAAKSGRDHPLLRKALGKAYVARGDRSRGIAQFRQVLALEPSDREAARLLMQSLDASGLPVQAREVLLALLDEIRHDAALYEESAERFADDQAEAERAATSIIEGGPAEAENHQALAGLRERKGRWTDAADEWRAVAELRPYDPAGLLGLAKAQLHLGDRAEALRTLQRLESTSWAASFAGPNLPEKIDALRASMMK